MDDFQLDDAMRDAQREAWHVYLDRVQSFRPLLHGYCRRLTRDLWDAEDLVQETLMRGFHRLGHYHDPIRNARAYLLRIATHAWIDVLRQREREAPAVEGAEAAVAPPAEGLVRDAGQRLLQRLAPRERAAVVLKDLFDMSLEESAVVLETSVGAVKSALHRGRERLREAEDGPTASRPQPSPELVDRFVTLYNAEDRAGLVELLLDNATVRNVGCGEQYGAESLVGKHSWIEGAMGGNPDWPAMFHFDAQRAASAELEGERLVLLFRTRSGEEALEGVVRLREEGGHVSRLQSYSFCPETMQAVGDALGFTVRTGPYRYPTPAPGKYYWA